jgi:alpha-beta hydrolase superfamily lysophospholipase
VIADALALEGADGLSLHVHRWRPAAGAPRATLQIVHGMGEHGARYARFAEALCARGYEAYAADCRGHGRSVADSTLLGHLADDDGWNRAVADVAGVQAWIARERPGIPHALLGHSMGSLLVLDHLTRGADAPAAVLLSGSSGPPGALRVVGWAVARAERLRLGARGQSALLRALLFGRFNRAFEPAATPFDWLSRDASEVARYLADPLCGFVLRVGGFCELATALGEIFRPERLARIPAGLPLLLASGERDPVHDGLRGFHALAQALRAAGLRHVEEKVYPGARHELLNETCRDEVTRDWIAWLDAALHFPVAATPDLV